MKNTLRKSNDKMIAGVCAGIADYFGWDTTLVRVLYTFLTIFSVGFPGIILYFFLVFIMPKP